MPANTEPKGNHFDDGLEEAFDAAVRQASTSGGPDTDDLIAKLSDEQRRSLDEACRKIKEIFEELANGRSGEAPSPKRAPTANQVIYNWISGRPTN